MVAEVQYLNYKTLNKTRDAAGFILKASFGLRHFIGLEISIKIATQPFGRVTLLTTLKPAFV